MSECWTFSHFRRFLSHFQVLFKNRTIQQSDNLKTGLAPYSDPLCRFIESLPRFSAKFFAGFLFAVSRRHSTHSRRQLWDDRPTRFGNRQKTYPVSLILIWATILNQRQLVHMVKLIRLTRFGNRQKTYPVS